MQRVTISQRRRLDFKRLFYAQLVMIMLVMLVAAWWADQDAVLSAWKGGMISLLPSMYFVWRGTRQPLSNQPQRNVLYLYQAAMGKFSLTAALFFVVFVLVPPSNPAFFFVAYVVAQLMHWLTPWLVRERSTPKT